MTTTASLSVGARPSVTPGVSPYPANLFPPPTHHHRGSPPSTLDPRVNPPHPRRHQTSRHRVTDYNYPPYILRHVNTLFWPRSGSDIVFCGYAAAGD